jgi:hypothetical protein
MVRKYQDELSEGTSVDEMQRELVSLAKREHRLYAYLGYSAMPVIIWSKERFIDRTMTGIETEERCRNACVVLFNCAHQKFHSGSYYMHAFSDIDPYHAGINMFDTHAIYRKRGTYNYRNSEAARKRQFDGRNLWAKHLQEDERKMHIHTEYIFQEILKKRDPTTRPFVNCCYFDSRVTNPVFFEDCLYFDFHGYTGVVSLLGYEQDPCDCETEKKNDLIYYKAYLPWYTDSFMLPYTENVCSVDFEYTSEETEREENMRRSFSQKDHFKLFKFKKRDELYREEWRCNLKHPLQMYQFTYVEMTHLDHLKPTENPRVYKYPWNDCPDIVLSAKKSTVEGPAAFTDLSMIDLERKCKVRLTQAEREGEEHDNGNFFVLTRGVKDLPGIRNVPTTTPRISPTSVTCSYVSTPFETDSLSDCSLPSAF